MLYVNSYWSGHEYVVHLVINSCYIVLYKGINLVLWFLLCRVMQIATSVILYLFFHFRLISMCEYSSAFIRMYTVIVFPTFTQLALFQNDVSMLVLTV